MDLRVVLVEDNAGYRISLETLLSHADEFSLAESFPSGHAVVAWRAGGASKREPPRRRARATERLAPAPTHR